MSERRRRSIFDFIEEYFEDLETWAERVRETVIERPSWDHRACTIEPLCDVFVTATEVIVTADLPYTNKNAVKVKPISSEVIEIKAKMRRKVCFEDFGITHRKGEFSTFHCQTRIPVPVNMNKRKVLFKRGILEIHLPRKGIHEIKVE